MNKPGRLQYKCRRCGDVFEGPHTPTLMLTIIKLTVEGDFYQPCAMVSEQQTHFCDDKRGVGVGDFIGGVFDAAPAYDPDE